MLRKSSATIFLSSIRVLHTVIVLYGKTDNPHPGELTPPHDISGRVIKEYIPKGDDTAALYDLMKEKL